MQRRAACFATAAAIGALLIGIACGGEEFSSGGTGGSGGQIADSSTDSNRGGAAGTDASADTSAGDTSDGTSGCSVCDVGSTCVEGQCVCNACPTSPLPKFASACVMPAATATSATGVGVVEQCIDGDTSTSWATNAASASVEVELESGAVAMGAVGVNFGTGSASSVDASVSLNLETDTGATELFDKAVSFANGNGLVWISFTPRNVATFTLSISAPDHTVIVHEIVFATCPVKSPDGGD